MPDSPHPSPTNDLGRSSTDSSRPLAHQVGIETQSPAGPGARGGKRTAMIVAIIALVAVLGVVAAVLATRNGEPGPPPTVPPTTEPPTTATPTSVPTAGAAKAWTTLWSAASGTPESTQAATAVAAEDPLKFVTGLASLRPRQALSSPEVTEQPDGTVTIRDCVLLVPTPYATTGSLIEGAAERVGGDAWRVTKLQHLGGRQTKCVQRELETAAIDAYNQYWDARLTFWDPPDPTSPLIDQHLTGNHKQTISTRLAEHKARNVALRGKPETHPQVIRVQEPTTLVLRDCQVTDPQRGLFDLGTGERLADVPPIQAGQRDLLETTMRLEAGRWKVADVQGREGVTCEFASPDALQSL